MRSIGNVLKQALLLGCFCCALAHAGAQPDNSSLLLDKLSRLLSFKADFRQQLLDANGNEIQMSTGSLQATRPGKLRWQTDAPMEQLIVADGETVWLYDPDLLQVTAQPYPEELARTPAMLLIGETSGLQEQYHVRKNESEGDTSEFSLLPKFSDSLYSKVVLRFKGDRPVAMALYDTLQQETRISFSDIELNRKLDAALFTFTVPEGADLIWNE